MPDDRYQPRRLLSLARTAPSFGKYIVDSATGWVYAFVGSLGAISQRKLYQWRFPSDTPQSKNFWPITR